MSDNWLSSITEDIEKLAQLIAPIETKSLNFIEGERREVAILFLDLQGFTTMSESMDHEQLHKLIFGVMRTLATVIEQHGGYVDKFEGDLVMALFGAQHASENDSIRCVQCGLRLFQALEDINRLLKEKLGFTLGARIGINFGWVTVAPDPSGHLTAIGDDVNLASRMESSATVNTIQVTDSVVKQCGEYFVWQDLGQISVRGKHEPIHVYRPIGFGKTVIERWDRSKRVQQVPYVGRQLWLDRLLEIWSTRSVIENPRSSPKHYWVGIHGEAGIGKSRLAFESDQSIRKSDPECMIIKGQTTAIAQPPFWLWITLLKSYFKFNDATPDSVQFAQGISRLRSINRTLEPATFDRMVLLLDYILSLSSPDASIKAMDEKSRRTEITLAIRDFIRLIAQSVNQLVLILDDLQWLDSGSREVLEFIVSNCETEMPIFFVGCYRTDRDDGQPVSFTMNDQYLISETIRLNYLPEPEIKQLINNILTCSDPSTIAIPDQIVDQLTKYSQGNPFYLEELLLDWIETGKLTVSDGKWIVEQPISDFGIPTSIASLIRARMDRLSKQERGALQQCSVLGFEFTQTLFRKVKEKIAEKYAEDVVLKELEFRKFLRSLVNLENLFYRFRLTTTRVVAYETLLMHNRKILHHLTAETMEEMFKDELDIVSEMLSIHWELSEEWDKSIESGIRGLTFLYQSYQNREGYFLAERLLELLHNNSNKVSDSKASEIAILFAMERFCNFQGMRDRQQSILNRLLELVDVNSEQFVDAKVREGNRYLLTGEYRKADEIYNEVLPIADRLELKQFVASCKGNIGLLQIFDKKYSIAEKLLIEAVEIFRSIGMKAYESSFLMNLGGLLASQRRINEAIPCVEAAIINFEAMQNRHAIANAMSNLSFLRMHQHQIDDAIDLATKAQTIFYEVGDRKAEGVTLSNLGHLNLRISKFSESEHYLKQALKVLTEVNDLPTIASVYINLIDLFEQQARKIDAIAIVESAIPLFEKLGRADDVGELKKKLVSLSS